MMLMVDMLLFIILFIAITGLILFFPFLKVHFKKQKALHVEADSPHCTPSVVALPSHSLSAEKIEALKADFVSQKETLEGLLHRKVIDETEYQGQLAALSRALLVQANHIQSQQNESDLVHAQKISLHHVWLIGIFLCIPIALSVFYLQTRYGKEVQRFDQAQKTLPQVVAQWVADLKSKEISANETLERLVLPQTIKENVYGTLLVMKQKQAREGFRSFYDVSLLANLYLQAELLEEAKLGYEKALSLKPDDFDTLSVLAQLEVALNGKKLSARGSHYFQQLIQLYPDNKNVLMNYALALFNSNLLAESLDIWQQIATYYPENNEMRTIIDSTILTLQTQIAAQKMAQGNKTTDQQEKNQGNVVESVKTDTQLSPASVQNAQDQKNVNERIIQVNIVIAEGLDLKDYPNAKLYLYARIPNQAGPPLLAKQLSVPHAFPVTFSLSNEDKMLPQMADIEGLEQLQIEAKISLSGSATPDKTDWYTGKIILAQTQSSVSLTFSNSAK